jgi:hypothetical protein
MFSKNVNNRFLSVANFVYPFVSRLRARGIIVNFRLLVSLNVVVRVAGLNAVCRYSQKKNIPAVVRVGSRRLVGH